ncbi:hypothetical protein PN498_08345 [Oscillatoria sp. CS-180]|uniref:hypothetical protein n=1 Tax=Oscillatoria sp. CS-180 TaxID=3021720 RepID=UPI00232C662B|nr:hypothetical protein [Oscillatoria sp. CS-180]MDB9525992.1 hypothetical protein [Oscillatoria sp. CS-180]
MELLKPDQTYTFSKFFDLKLPADELAMEFGYSLSRTKLNLPQYSDSLNRLENLRSRIEEILPYVDLSNETSRREILIAPVVTEVVHYTKARLRIEYPIVVTNQLQSLLDYLLSSQNELLVIEAKRQDLDYGMTQLVSEIIALDQWKRTPEQPILIGAVTTGKFWEFARLNRVSKHFEQGLESYRVPEDLEPLMRILVYALKN